MFIDLKKCSSFLDVWNNSAENFADRIAFISNDEEYTYFEINNMVNSVAYALVNDFNVKKGDKIAIILRNRIAFIISYLAILKVGGVAVPLNTRFKGHQFDQMFRLIQPVAVVTSSLFQDMIEPLLLAHPCVRTRFGVDIADPSWESGEAMISLYADEEVECPKIIPDDPAVILFTSGTSGDSKGVVLKHSDLLWNIHITKKVFDFQEDDIHILTVPLFHCTGLESIFPTSCYMGSTCVLDDQINPEYIGNLIWKTKATTFITVPTVLTLLTGSKSLDISRFLTLRLIAFSGSAIAMDTLRNTQKIFSNTELINFYGQTETNSIISFCNAEELQKHPASIGKPLDEIDVRIAHRDEVVSQGDRGELQIHKRHIASEYFGRPGEIEKRYIGEWFRTGDLAEMNNERYIFLKGRNSDLIIVGGENVFAGEVENVLNSHPSIFDSAVVGIPNAIFGEVVKAFVIPKSQDSAKVVEIKKYCFERLPSYKVPIEIEFVKEFPRSPSGKIQKSKLLKK